MPSSFWVVHFVNETIVRLSEAEARKVGVAIEDELTSVKITDLTGETIIIVTKNVALLAANTEAARNFDRILDKELREEKAKWKEENEPEWDL